MAVGMRLPRLPRNRENRLQLSPTHCIYRIPFIAVNGVWNGDMKLPPNPREPFEKREIAPKATTADVARCWLLSLSRQISRSTSGACVRDGALRIRRGGEESERKEARNSLGRDNYLLIRQCEGGVSDGGRIGVTRGKGREIDWTCHRATLVQLPCK